MIRTVLMATINSDHPQTGMQHAFAGIFGAHRVEDFDYLARQRAGADVARCNVEFYEHARALRPDWIWLQLQDTNVLTPETLRRVREALPHTVITHWTGDCRPEVSPYLGAIGQAAHVTFVSSVGQLPLFRAAGAERAHYLQIGVDWHEDVQGDPDWTPPFRVPDVVFCGNYYGARFPGTIERAGTIQALVDARIDVGIVGGGWPEGFPVIGQCHVKQQAHVYRRAKVAVNVNHFNAIERYYSDRQLIAMANAATVCWGVPGLEAEFRDDTSEPRDGRFIGECRMFRTPAQAVEIVQVLLADPEYRSVLRTRGRAAVLRGHTWFHRVLDALAVVEGLGGGP